MAWLEGLWSRPDCTAAGGEEGVAGSVVGEARKERDGRRRWVRSAEKGLEEVREWEVDEVVSVGVR